MRIMFFYLLIGMNVAYAGNSYSQTTKLNISLKDKTIKEVFSEIEKNSEYIFLYNDENLDVTKKVSVNIHSQTIDKILDEVFRNTDNTYYISDRQVFISKHKNSAITEKRLKEPAEQSPTQQITVTGTVTDTDGEPLIGVAVKLKSQSSIGVATNNNGAFSIHVKNMDETLLFTYVGMKPKELKLKAGTTNYKVVMESNETELGAVVVNAGIVQYNKMGFTGSYKTVTQEELRSVGNINVLQSLKSLDPGFVISDNNLQGSNPNQLANISIRGGSTVNISSVFDDMSSNPNEPLFILDGFESTLQVVNDLDINRIESITILKDAGSTAIYGSKGGNGVVVIETIKPKPGQVRIGYRGDLQLAVADLSVYNLMNAKEKLEFEVKAGRYGNINDWTNSSLGDYYTRVEEIERGVDTYWLKVPIQTAITSSHSLDVGGGGESGFLYHIGASFKNVEGVMKGSNRETFGGNVNLNYRLNNLNITNNLSTSVTNGYDGGWGSFSDFARANPYYRMVNEDGTIPAFLDNYKADQYSAENRAPNPYYNAMLASKRDTRNFLLTNNTAINWFIRPNLRWTASLSLSTSSNDAVSFKDPRHTDFYDQDYTLQGSYTSSNGKSWSYSANTNLNYSLNLKTVHNLTFTGRAAVRSMSSNSDSYTVTGFPKGVAGIPSYSYSYKPGSRPGYSEDIFREANFLLAFSYNYSYRYLFDFTYNADGSTAFGRNKKFQDFWSVGAGWNISSEPFAKNWKWMQHMKIRGSYGKNGNQNVSNLSMNVYSYYPGNDIFGAASYLSDLANPNLEWQVVTKLSAGIDVTLLDNRFNLTLDTYITDTDPMIVSIEQKPSSGVSKYPVSLGFLTTKGYELSANYQFIHNMKKRVSLGARLTAGFNRSEYGGFEKALNNLNESYKNEEGVDASRNVNSLVQFRDGGSPGDMWAVRSLGIDPATGREIFLKKDGTPTFVYSADDRVVIANKNPKVQGIFGLSFRHKELTANFNFRYSLGGYDMNSALFQKVENISSTNIIYNQDRRALYDRWQNPGDVSEFKSISLTTATPISSRFILRNNYFSGESARLAWDFARSRWIKSLGLRDLQLSVSYSDLFRISTIRQERGIDYPFQRAVTMGLSAQF